MYGRSSWEHRASIASHRIPCAAGRAALLLLPLAVGIGPAHALALGLDLAIALALGLAHLSPFPLLLSSFCMHCSSFGRDSVTVDTTPTAAHGSRLSGFRVQDSGFRAQGSFQ